MPGALAALLFVILQKYDFSSKSQHIKIRWMLNKAVCDTAKVRFFKQITTRHILRNIVAWLFVILQKYDFSSKSQLVLPSIGSKSGCLWYCKSTIFQANHNLFPNVAFVWPAVCDTAKVRFFKQITTKLDIRPSKASCLWYCKSTIFQANHNTNVQFLSFELAVCDTAKVRFFKQITTCPCRCSFARMLFVILQKYDFSSKSQLFWYY